MAEHELDLREPNTHTTSSHWREWLLCEDYALSHDELREFYDYKREVNILFQDGNERWDLVKQLYQLYFNKPAEVEGPEWMKLGFQGKYPETDFRGGGVFSLKLILRFTQTNLQLVKVMETDKGNFFFALTAINIAFWMKKYFHLADDLIVGRDENEYCNRRALKNFCRVIISERFTYEQMHEMFLKHFYNDMWVPTQNRHPEMLLQFNSLFEELKKKIRNTFENHNIQDFHEFINFWREVAI